MLPKRKCWTISPLGRPFRQNHQPGWGLCVWRNGRPNGGDCPTNGEEWHTPGLVSIKFDNAVLRNKIASLAKMHDKVMLPKRRFWKTEQWVGSAFSRDFARWEYSFWASNHRKVPRKSTPDPLFRFPKSSFGRHKSACRTGRNKRVVAGAIPANILLESV